MIDPIELLSRQVPAFSIGAETRSVHLTRIYASLEGPLARPQTPLPDVGLSRTPFIARFRRFDWRGRLTAATVAFLVAIPSAAVASEGSQPDSWLYPVKLAVEPVWRLVDSDIVAKHRIEELQFALDESLPIDTLLTRADTAVAGLDHGSTLRSELARIKMSLADENEVVETGTGTDQPDDATTMEGSPDSSSSKPTDDSTDESNGITDPDEPTTNDPHRSDDETDDDESDDDESDDDESDDDESDDDESDDDESDDSHERGS